MYNVRLGSSPSAIGGGMSLKFGAFDAVPLVAALLAIARFFVPVKEVLEVREQRRLGEL